MASQEAAFVLCNEWACTGAEDGDFSLDILDIVVVGLEVNLKTRLVSCRCGSAVAVPSNLTCLMATVSPVALSMPL